MENPLVFLLFMGSGPIFWKCILRTSSCKLVLEIIKNYNPYCTYIKYKGKTRLKEYLYPEVLSEFLLIFFSLEFTRDFVNWKSAFLIFSCFYIGTKEFYKWKKQNCFHIQIYIRNENLLKYVLYGIFLTFLKGISLWFAI